MHVANEGWIMLFCDLALSWQFVISNKYLLYALKPSKNSVQRKSGLPQNIMTGRNKD